MKKRPDSKRLKREARPSHSIATSLNTKHPTTQSENERQAARLMELTLAQLRSANEHLRAAGPQSETEKLRALTTELILAQLRAASEEQKAEEARKK